VGPRDCGIAIQPLANFSTHLAENFLHSQTKPVIVKYTMDPIQIKDTGARQLSVKLKSVLL
jgi:hypothetical protein